MYRSLLGLFYMRHYGNDLVDDSAFRYANSNYALKKKTPGDYPGVGFKKQQDIK